MKGGGTKKNASKRKPRKGKRDSVGVVKPPPVETVSTEEAEGLQLARLEKKRLKTQKLAAKKRGRLEREREDLDARLRSDPCNTLWGMYRAWAGDRLTDSDCDSEQWDATKVLSVNDEQKLCDVVRPYLPITDGADVKPGGGNVPGVRALVLAASAVSAVRLAPMLYDGEPVGKLFSKHFKPPEQAKWLRRFAKRTPGGVVRAAVGTAKRVHVLCDADHMTLDYTTAFVIDCTREPGSRNCILEMNTQREELFALMHEHLRERMNTGNVKIILRVPDADGDGDGDKKKAEEDEKSEE